MLRAEQLQAQIMAPDPDVPVNGDEIVRLSSECRRIRVSLKSKTAKNKPAGPTLAEYAARKAAEKAASAVDRSPAPGCARWRCGRCPALR
jgi:hypothetical protein